MNEEFLKNIWDYLSSQELTATPFDEWVINVQEDEGVQKNIHKYLTDQKLTDSNFDTWLGNIGVKKKDETDMVSGLETGISQPNTLSRNQRLSITPTAEKDTAIERAFGKNEVTDFFGDMYRAWKTGAGQGATVDDAIKVFASGSNVSDKNLQQYIDAVENMESFAPSEEMQDFSRIYEAEGKGIKGFIKGIAKNPTAAIQVVASSLRAMLNPASIGAGVAGAGAGALAGPAGAGAGAIIGMTGALETGLSFTEFLKEELNEKSLDFTDDNIRTILEDDEAMGNITRRSLARGATISTISALTGGLAAGVGANVGRNVALKLGTQAGRAASAAAGLGVQAVGGGAGEAIGRAAAGQEMDVAEIGFEALGEIASPSLIGTITAVAKVPKYKVNTEEVSEDFVKDIIGKSKNYLELDNIDIEIIDNPVLNTELEKRKKELLDIENYKKGMSPQQLANATEEDILELVSLQNELTKYNESGNEAGKDNAANKKAQIINKLNAFQEPSTEEISLSKQPKTSPTVGKGDTKQQSTTTEAPSEPVTGSTKQTKEVETQVEDDASTLIVIDSKDKKLEKAGFQVSKDEKLEFLQDIKERGLEESSFSYEVKEVEKVPEMFIGIPGEPTPSPTADITVTYTNPDGTTGSFDSTVALEPLTQTEQVTQEEVVEEVAPIEVSPTDKTQKIGEFEVILTKDNVIKSIKKKGQEVSTKGRQKAESLLVEQGFIKVIPQEITNIEGLNPIDAANKTLDESNNPQEIAFAIRAVDNIKTEQSSQLKEALQSGLPSMFTLKQKFTPTSIIEVIGNKPSELGKNFTRTWVSKDGKSLEDGFIDENGIQFTKEQVAEFITNFPNKTEYNNSIKKSTVDLKRDLENKLKEITGINPSAENIKLISEITEEGIREAESKAVFEAEKLSEQKPIVPPEQRKTPKADKPEPRPDITDGLKTLDESFANITEEAVKTNLDNFASQVKSNLTRRGVLTEQARGTSTMRIDQAFGLNNSTKIYRTVIRPIIDVYTEFKTDYRRVNTDAEKAEDFIRYEGKSKTDRFLGRGRKQNDVTKDLYEIRLYQLAREYISNIVDGISSDKSPNPVKLAQFTADEALAGRVLDQADGEALIDLLKKHAKNGQINPDEMYKKLKPSQKEALKILDKRNAELEQKIIKNAQRSDKELELINDYSHRVVLKSPLEQNVDVENEAKDFSENFEGVTEKERTGGVKPISFDPILSLLRGTQETNLSYYMKDEVGRIQALTSELFNKYKNGNKGQAAASLALANSVRELLRITYVRTFMEAGSTGLNLKREAERMGYRVLLGSVPRFAAELLGNAAMLVTQPAEVIENAYDKYSSISLNLKPTARDNYLKILENLNSAEVNKLGEIIGQADSKYSDPNNYLNLSEMRQSGMQSRVQEKMSIIAGMGLRQTYKAVNSISDLLMAGGDKLIARPLWISKFANEFKNNVKNNLNEDVDLTVDEFEKIADGTSQYLKDAKYAKSIKDATFQSDKTVAEFITSGNPFNAIIKNVRRDEKGEAAKNFYRVINSFMANFNLNEYATARFAVGAMLKDGEISKAQAGKLLAGILARMSSYVILYRAFSKYFDEVFLGAPEEEEEEEDVSKVLTRQLIGSMSTLMFRGGLGNIPALPVNYGIEYLNKEYLGFLRDGGGYDAYDDSIVYSLVGLDDFAGKSLPEIAVPILAGPYGPLAKTITRGAELAGRTQSRKTQDARDRAQEELNNRITFELLGQLGLIPFYKDIRRGKLKIRFQDKGGNTISPSELRKLDPDLYNRLYN